MAQLLNAQPGIIGFYKLSLTFMLCIKLTSSVSTIAYCGQVSANDITDRFVFNALESMARRAYLSVEK